MKKVITIIVAVIVAAAVLFGATMLVKKIKENTALATADTVYEAQNNAAMVTVSEDVALEMLSKYTLEALGIEKPVDEYILKLGSTEFSGREACLVELFLSEEDEIPQARYIISGYDCYVYDITKNAYLLLTLEGAFEVENVNTTTNDESASQSFYDEKNNTALHAKIDAFSKESLGFQKEPSEYIMVVTGASVVADDGKTVYIVRMYEHDGTMTNYTCAFVEDDVYKYDAELQKYIKL